MTRRFIAVLVFAFLIAGGVSLVFYKLMTANSPQKSTLATTRVVVAARDLQVGTLIKEDDVKIGEVAGSIPAGVTQKADLVVGRGVISVVYANEPLVDSRLAPRGAGAGLAAMIPPGMRAVAVRVNEVVGVAGFAVPGMRVDVLVSGTPPNNQNQGTITRTLLQNIEVLSAGQNYQKDTEGKPVIVQVVNLLVDPSQAETLSLAGNNASIQLVLRNPLDTTVAKTQGTGMTSLFGGPPPAPPKPVVRIVQAREAAAPPRVVKPPVMEMFEGAKRSEHTFTESAGGTQ